MQYGGQTPLKLAVALEAAGVPILGTPPDAIDLAEDRERFQKLLSELGLRQPENGVARSLDEALTVAARVGYPLVVRPSYVLGGRAMEVVADDTGLRRYIREAVKVSPDHPILLDQFVGGATELDVDCISDGTLAVVGGVMQHVEEAGVHSGDSACSLPPYDVAAPVVAEVIEQTRALAKALGVVGLMNVQYALRPGADGETEIFVLEVNPRASRTIPFVSKTIGHALAKYGARVMAGETLAQIGFTAEVTPKHVAVKESVFPFARFEDVDIILGPEMKSTGEVMGIADDFPTAFLKGQLAAGNALPATGCVLLSADDHDKDGFVALAPRLQAAGYTLMATEGTRVRLAAVGVEASGVTKEHEGGDHTVRAIREGRVQLVFCTTHDRSLIERSVGLRQAALRHGIPYFTTLAGARAAVEAIERLHRGPTAVKAIQDYHA